MSTRLHNGTTHCDCCGASTLEHRHTLTTGLALAFSIFAGKAMVGKPLDLSKLDFTRSQWQNFTKTKYWQFIVGTEKNGLWVLTLAGYEWSQNITTIQKKVWTWRDTPVEFEGKSITIEDAIGELPHYLKRKDYALASRTH